MLHAYIKQNWGGPDGHHLTYHTQSEVRNERSSKRGMDLKPGSTEPANIWLVPTRYLHTCTKKHAFLFLLSDVKHVWFRNRQ